ncbi:hypothetical protein Rs2_41088 [Raphanus sativus]|nr:hypothetical protein Rs2_41088 [Raphanus sativus]
MKIRFSKGRHSLLLLSQSDAVAVTGGNKLCHLTMIPSAAVEERIQIHSEINGHSLRSTRIDLTSCYENESYPVSVVEELDSVVAVRESRTRTTRLEVDGDLEISWFEDDEV